MVTGPASLLVTSRMALVGRPLTTLMPKCSASGNLATIATARFRETTCSWWTTSSAACKLSELSFKIYDVEFLELEEQAIGGIE